MSAASDMNAGRTAPAESARRRAPTGAVAGLVAALVVMALGAFFGARQTSEWTAESQLLLTPNVKGAGSDTSALFETLSRGQLPATAAAIISEPRFFESAEKRLGLTDADAVAARVTVVPETAVVRVEVTAANGETAAAMADELPEQAKLVVNELLAPYALTTLGSAKGTAELSSLAPGQWAAAVALAAVVVGIAVQQVVQQLTRARRNRSALVGL